MYSISVFLLGFSVLDRAVSNKYKSNNDEMLLVVSWRPNTLKPQLLSCKIEVQIKLKSSIVCIGYP